MNKSPEQHGATDALRLDILVSEPRARSAFEALGLETVADFLAESKSEILAVPGMGERTYQLVRDRIDALVAILAEAGAGPRRAEPESAEEDLSSPRPKALGSSVDTQQGSAPTTAPEPVRDPKRRRPLLATLLSGVDPEQRAALLNLLRRPETPVANLARHFEIAPSRVEEPLARLRERLFELAGEPLRQLLDCAGEELRIRGGVLAPEQVTPGIFLASEIGCAQPESAPLRLCAFLNGAWHFSEGKLIDAPESAWNQSVRRLRDELLCSDLPLRVENLLQRSRRKDPDAVWGTRESMFRLALERTGQATIRFRRGHEWVHRRRISVAERLEQILAQAGRELSVDDLLFWMRDRFQRGRRQSITETLRTDRRFLELEAGAFSLRVRHLDELEMARPLAEQWRDRILESDERVEVAPPGPDTPRSAYLAADLLRSDPAIRVLAGGNFRARGRGSRVLRELVTELRQAGGAVPFSRFLQNQDPRRRRLQAQLLRLNRSFVSPQPDRIDLAENYPLQGERLTVLLSDLERFVQDSGGYLRTVDLCAKIRDAGLLGSFFTPHLLLDVLRRHSGLQCLGTAFVADPGLRLGDWLRNQIRRTLRSSKTPMTRDQVIAACPELAEFDEVLDEFLESDPLLQSADRMHFEVG